MEGGAVMMTTNEWDELYDHTLKVLLSTDMWEPESATNKARNYMNTNHGPRPMELPKAFRVGGIDFKPVTWGVTLNIPERLYIAMARNESGWNDKQVRLAHANLGEVVKYFDHHSTV
jgi:hypothetical protein